MVSSRDSAAITDAIHSPFRSGVARPRPRPRLSWWCDGISRTQTMYQDASACLGALPPTLLGSYSAKANSTEGMERRGVGSGRGSEAPRPQSDGGPARGRSGRGGAGLVRAERILRQRIAGGRPGAGARAAAAHPVLATATAAAEQLRAPERAEQLGVSIQRDGVIAPHVTDAPCEESGRAHVTVVRDEHDPVAIPDAGDVPHDTSRHPPGIGPERVRPLEHDAPEVRRFGRGKGRARAVG